MTPKEKAIEIFSKYYDTIIPCSDSTPLTRNFQAKECSLIAVDEIFAFMENDDKESDVCYWANSPTLNYWYNVKQEIEAL